MALQRTAGAGHDACVTAAARAGNNRTGQRKAPSSSRARGASRLRATDPKDTLAQSFALRSPCPPHESLKISMRCLPTGKRCGWPARPGAAILTIARVGVGPRGKLRAGQRGSFGRWGGTGIAATGGRALAQARAAERRRVRLPAARQLLVLDSKLTSRIDPKYGVAASPRVVEPGQPVPKGGGVYRVGKPYQVAGRTYTPEENARYRNEGLASWYGDDFHGRLTANGEIYDMEAISAAHPTMPMPSYARVTSLNSHKSLIVRVNDRGPYHANREIDLSAQRGRPARLPRSRHRARAGRICRPGAAAGHRRPPAGRDLARGRARARAGRRDDGVEPVPAEFRPAAVALRRAAAAGAALRSRRTRRPRRVRAAYPQMRTADVERACWRARRWRAIRSDRVSPMFRPTPSRPPDGCAPAAVAAQDPAGRRSASSPRSRCRRPRRACAAQPPAVSPVTAYAPVVTTDRHGFDRPRPLLTVIGRFRPSRALIAIPGGFAPRAISGL